MNGEYTSGEYTSFNLRRADVPIALVATIIAVTRLAFLPRGFWEGEEIRFAQALLTFDPLHQQPVAPGYPLYVALGRFANFFIRDPFVALVAVSVLACVAGAVFGGRAASIILGNGWLGAAAAAILYFSPAMLVFTPLPNAEAVSVALVSMAFYFFVHQRDVLFAVAAAAAIGARPQIAPAMVLFFIFAILTSPSVGPDPLSIDGRTLRRGRVAPITVFLGALLVIFVPMVEAVGARDLSAYATTNYAAMRVASAATGAHGRELLMRFIAHPWGSKMLSFPVLIAAAAGFAFLLRRTKRTAIALALFTATHVAFCLAFADRTDGVKPVLPALVAISIFVAAAFARWPVQGLMIAILYGGGTMAYTARVLIDRRTPSPPAAAIAYARLTMRPDSVLSFEPSLEAYARTSGLSVVPVRVLDDFANRPEVTVLLLADGGSRRGDARTWSWPDSDVYGKVTTERYRVVSLIPFPPATRYRALLGVYALERTVDGAEWRWLAQDAVIELPELGAHVLHLQFALPDDSPIESNTVTVNGATVTVSRGQTAGLALPASPRLRIQSARSFTSERDRRSLGVQLVSLEQR